MFIIYILFYFDRHSGLVILITFLTKLNSRSLLKSNIIDDNKISCFKKNSRTMLSYGGTSIT